MRNLPIYLEIVYDPSQFFTSNKKIDHLMITIMYKKNDFIYYRINKQEYKLKRLGLR